MANNEPTSNIPVTCDLLKALPAGGQVHIAHDGLESDEDLEVLDAEDDDEDGDSATVPPSAGPAISNAQLALNTLPAGRHNSGAVAATVPAVAPTWPPGQYPPVDTTITDLAIIHNGRKLPKLDCEALVLAVSWRPTSYIRYHDIARTDLRQGTISLPCHRRAIVIERSSEELVAKLTPTDKRVVQRGAGCVMFNQKGFSSFFAGAQKERLALF